MAKANGGGLFAKSLKKEGVEQIFTLCGGHIMPILYGCREEGIEVVDCRHEAAAAYAADAYARVSGKPGIVVTTAGVGVTNTTTAIVEARESGVPIIAIGGASPLTENQTGPLQHLNSLEIMSAASKWASKIYHANRIPEYVSMAYRHALSGTPGPVYLECASDTLREPVEEEEVCYPEYHRTGDQPFGDPHSVEKAADLLAKAAKPAMIIGHGARFSAQYGEAIGELADYLKMPAYAQTIADGLFAGGDNPLFKVGIGALSAADVVLMLCVNNDYTVKKGKAPFIKDGAKLIQVHTDSARIGYNAPAHIGIIGGAGAVARQILEALRAKTDKKEDMSWFNEAAMAMFTFGQPFMEGFMSEAAPMHPGRCAAEVAKFLEAEGKDWTVVCDGGDSGQWMMMAATAHRPGQKLSYGPLGTLGVGCGYTLGAWKANKKPVLYYTGDGSFGFYTMEFDTFVRQGIPVVCVISNDSGWGMVRYDCKTYHSGQLEKVGFVGTELESLRRYEKLPAMWDGYGELVTDPNEIVPAIKRAYESGKPAIINVETDRVSNNPVNWLFL
ncbi:MAG: thiamine pyrophosphate-binding protein [Bacillota bacterium]